MNLITDKDKNVWFKLAPKCFSFRNRYLFSSFGTLETKSLINVVFKDVETLFFCFGHILSHAYWQEGI